MSLEQSQALDEEVVSAITSEEDFAEREGEEFLLASPAIRCDFSCISVIEAWICVAN